MKLGCHLSIRRGYLEAARAAVRLGANAFQYFPKNPRSLSIKSPVPADAQACAAFCSEHGIVTIAHTPYPTNPAVEPGELREATIASLRNDLEIANACGSAGIVVHFGKYRGNDTLQGYKNIIQCINEALMGYTGSTMLLIENQAGEGGGMGTTFEELVQVRKLCERPELVGFCFDTCHAFASGLWPSGGADSWDRLQQEMERTGYWPALQAVHLNDSVYPREGRKDRHAPIGRGKMGREIFARMLASPVWKEKAGLPVVLETPVAARTTHEAEIRFIRELSRGNEDGCVSG
ncbi:Endonuclease IV [Paenibacillus sp. UNCCL117]|uniref:deoxyribonuclease IV n=1 Tax=unclassified Paenibacillus TaxID=185978 RepID=UPI000883C680|nr:MULTISPECIES: deoxyribonuclease IV [unclassified Paenibacillus]SDC47379.1 Endonuclease IV [Paenibacillus sp. cl123]SFW12139.1 Endonuclease IV [Paenibacillus sp. UNCCL117]